MSDHRRRSRQAFGHGPCGYASTTRKYVTDGTPTTFDAQGAEVNSSAKWDENTLVVNSKVDAIGIAFNDKMTLSPDGQTLVSSIHIELALKATWTSWSS